MADNSPLLLPADYQQHTQPHLTHFGTLKPTGEPRFWLWLFPNTKEALSLGMIGHEQTYNVPTMSAIREIIRTAIPPSDGIAPKTILGTLDPKDLADNPDFTTEIDEVWYGFDYKRMFRDRSIRSAPLTIYSSEEFIDHLKRQIF